MTAIRTVLAILLVGTLATASLIQVGTLNAADDAGVLLEAAIQTELVDGDLDAAIALYAEILDHFGHEREVAARALLHLGQAYEKLGEPGARQAYERVLREYADQSRVAAEARAGLSALVTPRLDVEADAAEFSPVWTRPAPAVPGFAPNVGRFLIFSDLSVQTQSGENRRLSSGTRSAAYPVLSPDSRQVAYLSWGEAPEDSRRSARLSAELRVVGLDGSGDRALVSSEEVEWLRPFAWSPDGGEILTVFERSDRTNEIALVSVDDGSTRVLKSLDRRYPETLGFSSDGRVVAYTLPPSPGATERDVFLLAAATVPEPMARERRYSVAASPQTGRPSEDQEAIHVLNRLGYGPRLGDIERVRAMGIDAYIQEQLYPERIPDPVVEEKLAGFRTLGMTLVEIVDLFDTWVPVPQAEVRARVFEKRRTMEGAARGASRRSMEEFRRVAGTVPADLGAETRVARLIRAVYSERQLQEQMVDFWLNHFNINFLPSNNALEEDPELLAFAADFEQNVIRPRTLGTFEDLLMAVAKHPAMLSYLDNRLSSAPAEVIQARIEALRPSLDLAEYLALRERMPFLNEARGLNENYARELLELHTVGVDGGYTQQDIIEAARVLTGWTTTAWAHGEGIVDGEYQGGAFMFDGLLHVDGGKVVMGETIPSGGVEEGEQLLRMLAHHPSTARFIATKLARRFVADDPPTAVVDAAARTFQQTGGDIREVLRTIFTSPGFRSPAAYGAKIKKPFELVVSSLRAVDAQFDPAPPRTNEDDYGDGYGLADAAFKLIVRAGGVPITERMGERLYNYEAPDGNPDVAAAWINSNALLVRLEFANDLAANRVPGVRVDLAASELLLGQLGLPRPTAAEIEETRALLRQDPAGGLVPAGASMRGPAMAAGDGGPGSAGAGGAEVSEETLIVAAMLGSPRFQTR